MHQTFILVTQEAEKLGAKHRPIFFETPCTLYLKSEDCLYSKRTYAYHLSFEFKQSFVQYRVKTKQGIRS